MPRAGCPSTLPALTHVLRIALGVGPHRLASARVLHGNEDVLASGRLEGSGSGDTVVGVAHEAHTGIGDALIDPDVLGHALLGDRVVDPCAVTGPLSRLR